MAYRVFKCTTLSCKYVFKDGTIGYFVNGRLTTDVEDHIKELEDEIKHRHPTIFIDENDSVAETAQLDPMEEFKRKVIEEYEASKSAVRDVGNSTKDAGAGTGTGTSENTGTTATKIVAGATTAKK